MPKKGNPLVSGSQAVEEECEISITFVLVFKTERIKLAFNLRNFESHDFSCERRFRTRMVTSLLLLSLVFTLGSAAMPCPFSRELSLQSPLMQGHDVTILQTFLQRSPFGSDLTVDGFFGPATKKAVVAFQQANFSFGDGVVNATTAQALLDQYFNDNYRDDGTLPSWALYKVHIPVYRDRTRETIGTLYNKNLEPILRFNARTHGQPGRSLYCSNGDTPTGLGFFDLNSPEDDPKSYGPYPVNRVVSGIKGNMKLLLHNDTNTIRGGILLHTGEWDNWDPSQPMPNSHGCIHTHPDQCNQIWQALVKLGVKIRQNTDGKLPYPYVPQGVISVEQID